VWDIPLWVICGMFVGWELFAHFVAKNKEEHTLSNRIAALERRFPVFRAITAGVVTLLFFHLTFQVP
jgi:hypothetical protein